MPASGLRSNRTGAEPSGRTSSRDGGLRRLAAVGDHDLCAPSERIHSKRLRGRGERANTVDQRFNVPNVVQVRPPHWEAGVSAPERELDRGRLEDGAKHLVFRAKFGGRFAPATRLCFPLSTAEGVPQSKTKLKRAMGQESATTDQPPNRDHSSTMDPDVVRRMVALGAVADPRMVRRVTPTFRRMMEEGSRPPT